ncbi:MAG: exopolyphosphatase/guanosine-5'-triphosphate,3'-diphosphate pyrophosphatase [Alphaproteobacteria bacterium]
MSDLYQVFDDSQQTKTEMYAALDLGSNSFHLVVARVVADSVQIVSKIKQKVRLAEGLDERNYLSSDAITRGVAVLESMKESMQGIEPRAVRIVATHTLRRAKNSRAFLRQARKVLPFPIEIISGNEEARLIFVGIGSNSSYSGERLIFDIGGGSTEFAVGSGIEPKITKSIQMGCVSYQQRFFESGEITKDATRKAITAAKVELELAAVNLNRFKWEQTVASSGTARAVCSVVNIKNGCSVDAPVSYQALIDLLSQCTDLGHSEALKFGGLSLDRQPVFVAGLCILIGIFQSLKISEMVFSEAALREGVLYELQPSHNSQNVRMRTAQSLATRYVIDTNYAHKVLTSCMYIFDNVKDIWELHNPSLRHFLGWAALLHEVGLQIHSRGIQKHSSYILQHSEMAGFNQDQQQIIAFLVRFHRKKIRKEELLSETSISEKELSKLLVILRLGILLNMNRLQSTLPKFTIAVEGADIKLGFAQEWFALSPLLLADIARENAYLKNIDMHLTLL